MDDTRRYVERDTFMLDFAALAELERYVRKYGHFVALTIWEMAEADAIEAGEDHISFERMAKMEREYLAQE